MKFGIITVRIGTNDGQGRVNREIAAEALRQGHEVVLFSEHVDQDIVALDGVSIVLAPPPSWLPSRLLRDQSFALRSRAQLRRPRNACDAVLVNGFATWAKSDINAVHFVHDSWARSAWHPWRLHRDLRSFYALVYSRLNMRLEKAAFRRARRVVAVSDKVGRELSQLGVPADRIVMIRNGVDTSEFRPGAPDRQRFGLPPEVPIGLFAGDLKSSRKNLDTVLRALTSVPGFHLAVAGRAEGTPYPALASRLGLSDRVHFLGFQQDIPALMRSVDLLICPSRYEPFGLVLLEALASGLPVVTARTAGGAEIVTPDVGIVLEDPEDFRQLGAALQALLGDDGRRAAMAARAHAFAQKYSWRATASRYVELLCEAAYARSASHA